MGAIGLLTGRVFPGGAKPSSKEEGSDRAQPLARRARSGRWLLPGSAHRATFIDWLPSAPGAEAGRGVTPGYRWGVPRDLAGTCGVPTYWPLAWGVPTYWPLATGAP
jgi:hypothetical protein